MKLNQKLKTILSVAVFLLVFLALILIATFCDLQISDIMTKGILKDGDYFATDFLGVMLEAVGCTPIYLLIAFVLCVLFWSCLKLWKTGPQTCKPVKKPLNIICAVVCAIGVAAACWYALKDSIGYVFEHVLARSGDIAGNLDALDKFEHSAAMYGIEAFFGVIMAALAIVATKQFKPETLKKLLWFCLAAACAVALANILMFIIKGPVGRMRYRAIHSDLGAGLIASGELKGYTQWFVSNGQPSKGILDSFLHTYGVKDAFKSFPSGHTCSAGTVYTLIMIPTLFGFKEKNKKGATLACWLVPILYTAIVAISRIMVGAHFMSDVTFGGTIAFVCAVIMWEIFMCKGSHFFAVFPKLQKAKAGAADGEEVENAGENEDTKTVANDATDDVNADSVETYVDGVAGETENASVPTENEENEAENVQEKTPEDNAHEIDETSIKADDLLLP
ncbi:MAG: phosphatase PAP2 family protein [Roseburia sp.]|nr:phosphatase PAP2 family protein [Bacillota bacterium]MCM1394010.1 phosphatase PAP2 family protein [[Eubacterium] siraeum]MCM1440755.1 phosphatase PAP2 family protein [Roseburia sp.]